MIDDLKEKYKKAKILIDTFDTKDLEGENLKAPKSSKVLYNFAQRPALVRVLTKQEHNTTNQILNHFYLLLHGKMRICILHFASGS